MYMYLKACFFLGALEEMNKDKEMKSWQFNERNLKHVFSYTSGIRQNLIFATVILNVKA